MSMKSLTLTLLLLFGLCPAAWADKVLFHPVPGDSQLPFSSAVEVGNTIYLAGTLGNKPGAMEVVPGGIVPETHQLLGNIKDTLKRLGLGMEHVVKCTVMLADIAEWGAFNEVYVEYFKPPYPARSAFGASGLALGARVEVECIAARP